MREWTSEERSDARKAARGTVYRMIDDPDSWDDDDTRNSVIEDLDIEFNVDDDDGWSDTDWDKLEDFNALVDDFIAKELKALLADIQSWKV